MRKILNLESFAYNVSWARTLGPRAVMDYALIGMGNSYYKRQGDLKKTLFQLDNLFENIGSYVDNHGGPKAKEAYSRAKNIEKEFVSMAKKALTSHDRLTLEEGKALNQKALEMGKELKDLFGFIYQKNAKKPIDATKMAEVSEAVEIAMDTQEVVSLYLLRVWGDRREAVQKALSFKLSAIEKRIDDLMKRKGNTAVTIALLEGAKKEIQHLKIMNDSGHYFIPVLALKKSEDMVLLSKDLAKHYLSYRG